MFYKCARVRSVGWIVQGKERLWQEHNLEIFVFPENWYQYKAAKYATATNTNSFKNSTKSKKSTLKTQNYSGMRLIILVTLTGIRLSRSWTFPRAIARFSWQGTLRSWLWTVGSHSCHSFYGHRAKPLMTVRLMHVRLYSVYNHC